jgi:hypothetical protein
VALMLACSPLLGCTRATVVTCSSTRQQQIQSQSQSTAPTRSEPSWVRLADAAYPSEYPLMHVERAINNSV